MTGTERPSRAAKTAAYQGIEKSCRRPKKRARHTGDSQVENPIESETTATVTDPAATDPAADLQDPDVSNLDDESGCRDVCIELKKYCRSYIDSIILPGKRLQATDAAEIDTKHVHPAVPQADPSRTWTQDDEIVQSDWQAQQAEWEILPGARLRYGRLWRICLQFAECTPWDIVGARTNMRFELGARAPAQESQPNHMWSRSFCDSLSVLVTHCTWPTGGHLALADTLAAALQYVVILRTGDNRHWDPTFGGRDPIRAAFRHFSDGHTPMREVHKKVREYMVQNRHFLPSFSLSHLFLELEKLIASPDVSTMDDGVYWIQTVDLATLIRALDNMTHKTGYKQLPAKLQYEAAMACRPKGCLPSGDHQLKQYHEAAMLEELRRYRTTERSLSSSSAADEAPDETQVPDEELLDAGPAYDNEAPSESMDEILDAGPAHDNEAPSESMDEILDAEPATGDSHPGDSHPGDSHPGEATLLSDNMSFSSDGDGGGEVSDGDGDGDGGELYSPPIESVPEDTLVGSELPPTSINSAQVVGSAGLVSSFTSFPYQAVKGPNPGIGYAPANYVPEKPIRWTNMRLPTRHAAWGSARKTLTVIGTPAESTGTNEIRLRLGGSVSGREQSLEEEPIVDSNGILEAAVCEASSELGDGLEPVQTKSTPQNVAIPPPASNRRQTASAGWRGRRGRLLTFMPVEEIMAIAEKRKMDMLLHFPYTAYFLNHLVEKRVAPEEMPRVGVDYLRDSMTAMPFDPLSHDGHTTQVHLGYLGRMAENAPVLATGGPWDGKSKLTSRPYGDLAMADGPPPSGPVDAPAGAADVTAVAASATRGPASDQNGKDDDLIDYSDEELDAYDNKAAAEGVEIKIE